LYLYQVVFEYSPSSGNEIMSFRAVLWTIPFYYIKGLYKGRYPLLANTLRGSALFMAGDAITQHGEIIYNKRQSTSTIISQTHQEVKFDWDRLGRLGITGIIEGPLLYIFYKRLDAALPGRSKRTIVKKLAADLFIGGPIFNITFFMSMSLLEGKTLRDSWVELVKKFPTVFLTECLYWPPCQFLNFYYVAPAYRVLYVNVVAVLWNIFLSHMKHYDQYEVEGIIQKSVEP